MYSIFNNSLEYSGNNTTMRRISNLVKLPTTCQIKNKIIGIHAYKFGKYVYDKGIEYILIIGGTDIYVDIFDKQKKEIIVKALNNAKHVIAFNRFILIRLLSLGIDKNKIIIIPQSVTPTNVLFYNLYDFAFNEITKKNKISYISKIYLMVGNIRLVKDPLFVESVFEKLEKKGIVLLLIGNIIEGNYTFKKGMYHVGPLKSNIISSFYSQAAGLINCSKSEGMSISILEAMINGCPVYARNIEGNIALIHHKINGFIFETPDELYELLSDKKLDVKKVSNLAKNYAKSYHNSFIEEIHYEAILK